MAELQKLQDYMNLFGMGTIHDTRLTDYPALIKQIMYQFKPFAEFVRLQRLSMKQVVNMAYNLLYIYYNYVPRLVPEAMFAQVEHEAVIQQKIKITLLIMKIFVWLNVKNAKIAKSMRNNFYVFLPEKYKFQDFDFYLVTNCIADKDDSFYAQQKYIKEQKHNLQYNPFNISEDFPSPNNDYINQYKTIVLNLQPTDIQEQKTTKYSKYDEDLNASALMMNRENVERSRSTKKKRKMKKAKELSDEEMDVSVTNQIKQIQITKKQINNQNNKYWSDQKQKQEQEIKDYEKFRQQLLADDVLVGELKQKINPVPQIVSKQMTYQDLLLQNSSVVNQSQQLQQLSQHNQPQSPEQISLTQNNNSATTQTSAQIQPVQQLSVSLQTSPHIIEQQTTQQQREQQLYQQMIPQPVQQQPVSILKNPIKQNKCINQDQENVIQPQVVQQSQLQYTPQQQIANSVVQNSHINHQILHQFNNSQNIPQNDQENSNLSFSNSYVNNSVQQLPQVSQVLATPQHYNNIHNIQLQPQYAHTQEQYVSKQHISKQQAEYLLNKYKNPEIDAGNEISLYQVSPLQENKQLSESITNQYNQLSASKMNKSSAISIHKSYNKPKLLFDQEVLCEAIKLVQEEQEQKLKTTIQQLQLEQNEKDRIYKEGIERLNLQIEEQKKKMSTMESEYQAKQQLLVDTNKQQLDLKDAQLQQQQELLNVKTQQIQVQEQKIQNFELEKGQLETQQTILQRQLHEMLQKQQQEALQMQQQQQDFLSQYQQQYIQQQQYQQQFAQQQLQLAEERRKQQIRELEQQVLTYSQQVQQQLQSSQSVLPPQAPQAPSSYQYYQINLQAPQQQSQEPADTTQLQSECPQTLQTSNMCSVSAIDESGSYTTMDFQVEKDDLLDRKNKEKVGKRGEKLKFYKNISIEDDKIQQIGEILMKETEDSSEGEEEDESIIKTEAPQKGLSNKSQQQQQQQSKKDKKDKKGSLKREELNVSEQKVDEKRPKKQKILEESDNQIQLNLTQTNVNDRFTAINKEYEKAVKKKLPPIQIRHSNRSMEHGEKVMREVELRRSRLASSFDDAYDQLKITKGVDTGTSPVKNSDQGSADTGIGSASTVYNINDSFSEGKFKKGFMKQFISSQLSMSPDFTMHVVGEKVNKIDGKKYKQIVLESK